MKFKINKFKNLIKNNSELSFLFLLVFLTLIITDYYNHKNKIVREGYKDLVNNTYFQKSLNHVFDNLSPKFKNISHKVKNGETFDKILSNYMVSEAEIIKVKDILSKEYKLNNLKTNSNIKFTIDVSSEKKIESFLFPVSRTKKILLTRNFHTNICEKKRIITNLNE